MPKKRTCKNTDKVIKKVARWVEGGWAWSYPFLYGQWARAIASPVAWTIAGWNPRYKDTAGLIAGSAGLGGSIFGGIKGTTAMLPRAVPETYKGSYQPIEVLPTHGWRGFLSSWLATTLGLAPAAVMAAAHTSVPWALAVPPVVGLVGATIPGILHYFSGPWFRRASDFLNYWNAGTRSDKKYVETVLDTLRFSDDYIQMKKEFSKLDNIYSKNIHNWETLLRMFDNKYPHVVAAAMPDYIRLASGVNGIIEPVGMFAHHLARLDELPPDVEPRAYLVGGTLAGMVAGALSPHSPLWDLVTETAGYALRSEKAPKSLEELKRRYMEISRQPGVVSEKWKPILDKRMQRLFEAAEAIRKIDIYKSPRLRESVEAIFHQIRPVLRNLMEDSYADFLDGVRGVRRAAEELGVK